MNGEAKLAVSDLTCDCRSITFNEYLGLQTTVTCAMCGKIHWINVIK